VGDVTTTVEVQGRTEPGWGGVADIFARNFAEQGDVGANVAVYRDGEVVVDLWGGSADADHDVAWEAETVSNVFSCSKGLLATVANMLIQEARLDPAAPVARYWPEFAANGKADITVGTVLSHQAGLAAIAGEFTLDEALSWTPVVEALAAQATGWVPGTRHGYHMRSFGWLTGELIRRVTGTMPGEVFARRIAGPLGLSAWIGMPVAEQHRCARLIPPDPSRVSFAELFGADSLQARVFTGPSGLFHYDDMWNRTEIRSAEIPSSGGIADARSLARMYAACVGEVDGVRLLTEATAADAAVTRAAGPDEVLMVPTAFGLGYMVAGAFPRPSVTRGRAAPSPSPIRRRRWASGTP
jgi:CubicO group peptidase (beta-lactamase class C family)